MSLRVRVVAPAGLEREHMGDNRSVEEAPAERTVGLGLVLFACQVVAPQLAASVLDQRPEMLGKEDLGDLAQITHGPPPPPRFERPSS